MLRSGNCRKPLAFLLSLFLVLSTLLGTFTPALARESTGVGISAAERQTVEQYYSSLDTTLRGTAFKKQLAKLITDTHTTKTTYDGLRNVFAVADADPNKPGNVIWFYTGTSVPFSGFGSAGGTSNREHVWPKDGGKAFSASSGPGADGHHLRPTEANLNSTRGSKSFDEVPQTAANIVKQNGSTSYGNLCYTSGSFFYPGEGYRGATARILFYMYVRWGEEFGLSFVDSAGSCKTIGKISTLLKWHLEEPPTEEEIRRNEAVYGIQGNRNPFIDHPEYAEMILLSEGKSYDKTLQQVVATYGSYLTSQKAESITLTGPSSVAVGQSATLHATVVPANATSAVVWSSSDTSVATVSGGVVTPLCAGNVTITATSSDDGTVKASLTLTVKAVTAITVTGTPVRTEYVAGQTFDPTGLTVTATYTDGSTGTLSPDACEWLDGETLTPTLAAGTTEILCAVGNAMEIVGGISVRASSETTVVLDIGDFPTDKTSYSFKGWETDGIKGIAYTYVAGGKMQFNNSKPSYYLTNTTPLPAGLTTVTVRTESGDFDWELRLSNAPFGQVEGIPASGTSAGVKEVTHDGVTWNLDGTYKYFALCYRDSGKCVLLDISLGYGTDVQKDSVTLTAPASTVELGKSLTLAAQATGSVSWSVSDTSVATVSSTGVVTPRATGAVTVYAVCGASMASVTLTVVAPVTAADAFTDAVSAAVEADEGEGLFGLLWAALDAWDELSPAEQTAARDDYDTLLSLILDYNDAAEDAQRTHDGVVAVAVRPLFAAATKFFRMACVSCGTVTL